jgi:hypothetical protein
MRLTWRVFHWVWIILWLLVSCVYAEYQPPIYLYSQVGTQGVGVGTGMKLNNNWVIRAEVNGFNYTKHRSDANGLTSTEKRSVRAAGVYADYFPYESSVRFTGGLMLNQANAQYVATATGSDGAILTLNGTEYHLNQGEIAAMTVKTSPIMPYLGVGYGHDDIEPVGFNFHADIGVGIGQKPKTSLVVNAPSLTDDPTLEANRQAEESRLQKKLKVFEFVPVIKLGMGYTW